MTVAADLLIGSIDFFICLSLYWYMKHKSLYRDLFRQPSDTSPQPVRVIPVELSTYNFKPTVLLSRVGFRNIANYEGVDPNTGSRVFKSLVRFVINNRELHPDWQNFIFGKQNDDSGLVDLRLTREIGGRKIQGVAEAGNKVLRRCQLIMNDVVPAPETLDKAS